MSALASAAPRCPGGEAGCGRRPAGRGAGQALVPSLAPLALFPGPGTVCSASMVLLSVLCSVQGADGKSRQAGVGFFASFPMCHFLFCLRKLGNLFFSLCLFFFSVLVGLLLPDL